MPKRKMKEFEFTLVLDGIDSLPQETVDALFEAGCDDGLVGMCCGRVSVSFDRAAPSFRDAVESAMADVAKANVGASVLSVAPGSYVTQAEIARRIGRTRANVSQLINGTRGPGGFPGTVNDRGESPLWRWFEVAPWLHAHGLLDEEAVAQADYLDALNLRLAGEWRARKKSPRKQRIAQTAR